MKWNKLMFVIPNTFTVSSIFCGLYAIALCMNGSSSLQLYNAAVAIFFAMFFDGFDGRVARLTRTQSDFGVQLDSLADVISFGVAPALLIYKWALEPMGFIGLFICFAYATCGALRLARFNVMAQRKIRGCSKFFTGLPIPLAAGMLISLVIAYHHASISVDNTQLFIAALMVFLSFLMISSIRYRTFKDVRLSKKSATIFFAVLLSGIAIATQMRPSFVLIAYFSAYLFLGVAEEVFFFKKRRAEFLADKTRKEEEDEEENGQEYV